MITENGSSGTARQLMTDQNKPTTELVNARRASALAQVKVASLVRRGLDDLARLECEKADLGTALHNAGDDAEDYLAWGGHYPKLRELTSDDLDDIRRLEQQVFRRIRIEECE